MASYEEEEQLANKSTVEITPIEDEDDDELHDNNALSTFNDTQIAKNADKPKIMVPGFDPAQHFVNDDKPKVKIKNVKDSTFGDKYVFKNSPVFMVSSTQSAQIISGYSQDPANTGAIPRLPMPVSINENINVPLNTSDLSVNQVLNDDSFKARVPVLTRKYSTRYAYMRSLFWEGKRNDFSLQDYFVEVEIEQRDMMGYKTSQENISYENLFTSDEASNNNIVLLTGSPGFGKTTLTKKLAYDWATKNNFLSKFDILVNIPLRELGDRTIPEAILDAIFKKPDKEAINAFKRTELNFLILLDGFDEIVNDGAVIDFLVNDSVEMSSKLTVLVTSRPHAVEDIREVFQCRLSIAGFSKESQKKYIQLVFHPSIYSKSKTESLFHRLGERTVLSELAKCPLMLHLMCCIHNDIDITTVKSLTDLYIDIFCLILRRYEEKYGSNPLLDQGEHFMGEKLLAKLGNIAEKYLNKKIRFLTLNGLQKFFLEEEYKILVQLDLLVPSPSTYRGQEIVIFDPLHWTFFEFLTALNFVTADEEFGILKKLLDGDEFEEPSGGVYYSIHYINYMLSFHDMTFTFICGLTKDKETLVEFFIKRLANAENPSYYKLFKYLNLIKKEGDYELWKMCCSKLKSISFNISYDSISDLECVLQNSSLDEVVIYEMWEHQCDLKSFGEQFRELLEKYPSLKYLDIRTQLWESLVENDETGVTTHYYDIRRQIDLFLEFAVNFNIHITFPMTVLDILTLDYPLEPDPPIHEKPVVALITDITDTVIEHQVTDDTVNNTLDTKYSKFIVAPENCSIRMAKMIYLISPEQYEFLSQHFLFCGGVEVSHDVVATYTDERFLCATGP